MIIYSERIQNHDEVGVLSGAEISSSPGFEYMENGKKLKVVELFSGIGAQAQGLKDAGIGFESVCCEIDAKAHKSYCAIHGDTPNLGDITKLQRLPEADLVTWSFPCLRGDMRVQTSNGPVPIKDVKVGDMVQTHTNTYSPVTAHAMTGIKKVIMVKTMEGHKIVCTPDHRFLTICAHSWGAAGEGDIEYEWVPAKDLLGRVVLQPNEYWTVHQMYHPDAVVGISELPYEEEVYDICVEDAHSFVAEGIVVHNCTDLSIASGTQKGFVEGSGTRSALAWEVIRLLETAKDEGALPEYLLMENVPAILNKRNLTEFKRLVGILNDLGYTSSYDVLNAKDYGVPQNRKRCFMVSTLHHGKFRFPEPCPDGRVLKDVLEPAEDVPDKLWLSKEKIARYEEHCQRNMAKGNNFGWKPTDGDCIAGSVTTKADRQYSNYIIQAGKLNMPGWKESICRVYDADGVSPTITTPGGGGHMPKIKWPSGTQKGWMEAGDGDGLVMARPLTARGTVQPQQAPTVTCGNTTGVCVNDPRGAVQEALEGKLRIRYLTTKEAWRLQGFSDEAFYAAKAVPTSDTQLYKQAGNSIAVPCLKAIFKGMFVDETWESVKAPKALDAYLD